MNLLNKTFFSKKAVTLVEVLIAIFIIGVGVLPVLTMFLSGTRTVESGGTIFQVAVAAQNIMDSVRSDSFMWQSMPVELSIPSENSRGLYLPNDLIEKYEAKAELKIDEVKDLDRLYQIDLHIFWKENGIQKEYSLLNYRANTNIQAMKSSTRFN